VSRHGRPQLVALPGRGERQPELLFCAHCGSVPDRPAPLVASRVCERCSLGELIAAPADAVPSADAPFLLVDSSLLICSVSRMGERYLGLEEPDALGRHVTELLVPADVEAAGPESLVNLVVHAARGEGQVERIVLRPSDEYGIRFWAKIGPCGPPRAAVVTLADGRR
jgi:PAS domain-containing protein